MKSPERIEQTEQRVSKTWIAILGGLSWILALGILMQLLWKTVDRFYILQ